MASASDVAVVIPTYNGMRYLPEAVNSVLAQTYPHFTLYIVDDGSTDNTGEYAQSLDDPRVRYLRKPHGGPSGARNHGIACSSEPYLAFLDADDVWYPQKLEKQVALLAEAPRLGLVYGHQRDIDEDGRLLRERQAARRGDVFRDLLGGNVIIGSGSMVMLTRQILEHTGVFREDLKYGEDWELWLRIARRYSVDFVPEYLAAVRVHPGGAQQRLADLADGEMRLFQIITDELEVRGDDRRRLARRCLLGAAQHYYDADSPNSAKALLSYVRTEPRALRSRSDRRLFLRLALGHRRVAKIRRWTGRA
jgi:glycosyltransferase involved in cell wall biosynthesis